MINNKHIVIITPGFPADENDDNCIPPLQDYVRQIASRESKKISVITLQYPANKSNYRWHNVNVYALGGDDVKFPRRIFIWKTVISLFKRINADICVDAIHSFWLSECALLGNFLSSRYGIMHINTVMGKEAIRSNRYLRFINFDKLKLIVLSKRQEELLKKVTGENAFKIIPWGLDRNYLPTLKNNERRIDVLGVGSLIALKNYSSFINIIHKLKELKPELNCVILGGGPLKEKLNHQIKSLGLESNITLAGNLPRHQVFEYMLRSKILLHTSSYESFGMVFIEALYYGLHIVSKPVGIAMESGKWCICISDDEMVKKIVTLLSVKINHFSSLPYSINETVKSYLNIFFTPD